MQRGFVIIIREAVTENELTASIIQHYSIRGSVIKYDCSLCLVSVPETVVQRPKTTTM